MTERRYFVMSEEKSTEFLARYQEAQEPGKKATKEFLAEFGADNTWVCNGMSGEHVIGLVYNEKPDCKWLKVEGQRHNDKAIWVAYPNRRYLEGKHLDKQIGLLNSKRGYASDYSTWAVKELGMQSERMADRYLSISVAGYVKKRVVLSVPVPNCREQQFPSIHPDLTEIKKSEFIALTEE